MNNILNVIERLAAGSDTTANNGGSIWVYIALIGLVVLMLVLPMITQKKRNKEYATMLESLTVGDTVKTIGGVIGRVTKIQDRNGTKTFIMETGLKNAKTTMEFDVAAVGYILNDKTPKAPAEKVEVKEEVKEAPKAEEKVEEKIEEKAEEKKEEAKKPAQKKTTTAKKATSSKKATTKKASK